MWPRGGLVEEHGTVRKGIAFHAEQPDEPRGLADPAGDCLSGAGHTRGNGRWRPRYIQHAFALEGLDGRKADGIPVGGAREDNREFMAERHQPLRDSRPLSKGGPGVFGIPIDGDSNLATAVVAGLGELQIERQAEFSRRQCGIAGREHWPIRADRKSVIAEKRSLFEAVLGPAEDLRARPNKRDFLRSRERTPGRRFGLDGEDGDARGKGTDTLRVPPVSDDFPVRDCAGRGARFGREHMDAVTHAPGTGHKEAP